MNLNFCLTNHSNALSVAASFLDGPDLICLKGASKEACRFVTSITCEELGLPIPKQRIQELLLAKKIQRAFLYIIPPSSLQKPQSLDLLTSQKKPLLDMRRLALQLHPFESDYFDIFNDYNRNNNDSLMLFIYKINSAIKINGLLTFASKVVDKVGTFIKRQRLDPLKQSDESKETGPCLLSRHLANQLVQFGWNEAWAMVSRQFDGDRQTLKEQMRYVCNYYRNDNLSTFTEIFNRILSAAEFKPLTSYFNEERQCVAFAKLMFAYVNISLFLDHQLTQIKVATITKNRKKGCIIS